MQYVSFLLTEEKGSLLSPLTLSKRRTSLHSDQLEDLKEDPGRHVQEPFKVKVVLGTIQSNRSSEMGVIE